MTKILFVTGSRGEWGYIRPILKLIEASKEFTYDLCVTNMHLLPSYGNSYKEIEKDGFRIKYKINMSIDGYNHQTQVKSLGIFLSSFSDILSSDRPDWIVLAGDRGEQLMASIAGAYTYCPVLHIQAGERSGNIDGMSRHAIGKFTHIHVASNKDAEQRLIKLGEEAFRIHNVGAPQLDELVNGYYTNLEKLNTKFTFNFENNYLLVVQHPVTEEYDKADSQIRETMSALSYFDIPKIVIMPNNDAGSIKIQNGIEHYLKGDYQVFSNLSRQDYLGILKNASAIVGNSSSGILEAPTFKIPCINIGRRQAGREQAINVINCEFNSLEIKTSIEKALDRDFKKSLENECINPYGDGRSSERILEIISKTKLNSSLIVKDITY
ncbi:UDP-N-acetylglucosamine 2-epimerase [Schleiferiaceae bacterium]|nr:UDP-N-acetylglucosamine 2-epimerase [Schleiferiaceae bacterium]